MKRTKLVRPETDIAIEESSGSVFADLGRPDADARLAKAEFARAIRLSIKGREWTQKQAADVLGIAAPDVSDLMRGKLARFSQERLERFLNALDMDIEIRVKPRRAGKPRATVTVELITS
jgi:predicted XRE-type DNA-binding protein